MERGKKVNTGSDGRGEKRQMDRQGGEGGNKEWTRKSKRDTHGERGGGGGR